MQQDTTERDRVTNSTFGSDGNRAQSDTTMKVSPSVVDPQNVDAAWLTAALRRAGFQTTVASFDVAPVGTGQVGETYRYQLRYVDENDGAPASIIGKFHSSDAGSRAVARQLGLYRREYMFYRELVSSANVSAPHPYLVLSDPDDRFVMLLEDLAPARPADHLTGLSIEQALLALIEAAKLHASHWGDEALQASEWLQSPPLAQGIVSPADLAPFWPGFRERYADMVTPELLVVGDEFIARGETWNRPRSTPRSLTHNDFRADNFLFGTAEGGRPVIIVDWQTLTLSYGALDVAYMIGGAFSGSVRRDAEAVLLPAYHQALTNAGISDYDWDQFMADYRHFTFAGIAIAVIAAMTVGRTERGDRLFLDMFTHHASHVLDHDAMGCLSC